MSKSEKLLPTFAVDLVKELDAMYPEKCPSKDMPEREIWLYSGKRELVNSLIAKLEDDEKDELKNLMTKGED